MTLRDISKIQQLTQLKSENEMLGLLTSSVSHEMLTPLKCIISVAYRVKGLFHDLKHKEMVETIISAAGLTLNQVKCNLDRGLIDKKTFTASLEMNQLSKVVTASEKIIQTQAQHHKINIKLEGVEKNDTPVLIDSLRVQQIIINLLSNAIKFSEAGQTVTVALKT